MDHRPNDIPEVIYGMLLILAGLLSIVIAVTLIARFTAGA